MNEEVKIENLKKGVVYQAQYISNVNNIHIIGEVIADKNPLFICRISNIHGLFVNEEDGGSMAHTISIKRATPEQTKWLNICLKENRFIPLELIDKYTYDGEYEIY